MLFATGSHLIDNTFYRHGLQICYVHLAYVRFEHSVYRGSLMTTDIHIIYIYIYMYIYIYI